MSKKYPEKMDHVPCEKCGVTRKFRKIKHSGLYKNYKPLCACCSNRGRKHPTKAYIDVIDNEQKAYAFGFFWADGCINRYKTFTVRLQSKDRDILDFFHEYFGGSRSTRNFKRADGRPYEQEEWVIHDRVFVDRLKQCGFRQNLNAVPDELLRHFLRGLIDGDGTYAILNGRFSHIVIAGPIDEDFKWLTDRFEMNFSIDRRITDKGSGAVLRLKGGHNIMAILVRKMYNNSLVSMKRKREIVTPIMKFDIDRSHKRTYI